MPPCLPMPHPDPGPLSPPAPQPHIPFSSLSPSPRFLLSHRTSPWHAATAEAGELHGPQKSQAVRQSRRAARLCLANNPLMSFQKTRGEGKRHSFKSCFSFFLLVKLFFLMKPGGEGWGDVNYFTTRSWFPEETKARPPEARGSACEPLMGAVPGESVPSWDWSDPGTQSFHYSP